MPTYDYVCAACGHKFEHFHEHDEPPIAQVPRVRRAQA